MSSEPTVTRHDNIYSTCGVLRARDFGSIFLDRLGRPSADLLVIARSEIPHLIALLRELEARTQ